MWCGPTHTRRNCNSNSILLDNSKFILQRNFCALGEGKSTCVKELEPCTSVLESDACNSMQKPNRSSDQNRSRDYERASVSYTRSKESEQCKTYTGFLSPCESHENMKLTTDYFRRPKNEKQAAKIFLLSTSCCNNGDFVQEKNCENFGERKSLSVRNPGLCTLLLESYDHNSMQSQKETTWHAKSEGWDMTPDYKNSIQKDFQNRKKKFDAYSACDDEDAKSDQSDAHASDYVTYVQTDDCAPDRGYDNVKNSHLYACTTDHENRFLIDAHNTEGMQEDSPKRISPTGVISEVEQGKKDKPDADAAEYVNNAQVDAYAPDLAGGVGDYSRPPGKSEHIHNEENRCVEGLRQGVQVRDMGLPASIKYPDDDDAQHLLVICRCRWKVCFWCSCRGRWYRWSVLFPAAEMTNDLTPNDENDYPKSDSADWSQRQDKNKKEGEKLDSKNFRGKEYADVKRNCRTNDEECNKKNFYERRKKESFFCSREVLLFSA
eukprot:TRINITY_DN23100_c0_g4_i1.p1 TRINITY_DN23100_c0_g4~~TRINITY_DN23100_c0_g4_i1.p1  ORF type:complete len:491 (+),score=25.93 TRINITY_DN23100_c0_g4_i1:700-2172(+)